MGGDYELRCFEPLDDTVECTSIEYYTTWLSMVKGYIHKRKQYKQIYLIVRKTLKHK